MAASNFSLSISEASGKLTVALVSDKSVPDFMAGSGDMTVKNAAGEDASEYFTLDAITTETLQDMTDNIANSHWGASARDFKNGDAMAAGAWVTYTYTVNSSAPADTYTFTMAFGDDCCDVNFELYACNNASITGTYTIADTSEPTDPYSASISADKAVIEKDQAVIVSVNVAGAAASFAASQIVLTYDGAYLDFDPENVSHSLNGASITVDGNTITVVDHGVEQMNGEAYKLVFTGKAITSDTAIVLVSAKFDKAENAALENLQDAVLTTDTVNVAVKHSALNVTLPEDFASDDGETVEYNGTYTFYAKDPNYDYTVRINNGEITPSYDASTGKWTITSVIADLNIEVVTKTAKKFNVTINGMDAIDGTPATGNNAATYKENYIFNLKANIAATPGNPGYTYTVESITIGGNVVPNSWTNNGQEYTIFGDYITGDIVITAKETVIDPDMLTVTVETGIGELVADKTQVEKGGTVTLTLTPVTGYKYEIKVNDEVKTLDENNQVVLTNVNENLVVTATKSLDLSAENVSVGVYLKLDGKTVYLVQVSTKLDAGNVYTYDGQNMFWSEKYNNSGANAFLVILDNETAGGAAQVLDADAAIAHINISAGTATTIDYSGNVNMADAATVDANDAQLVYNMYQTKIYTEFTSDVTMNKFLRADMNCSGTITVEDAIVIVNSILGK